MSAIARAHGGPNGRQCIYRARDQLDESQRLSAAARKRHRKQRRAAARAALAGAAGAVRIAALTPLDEGYLHALTLQQLQAVRAEVEEAIGDGRPERWRELLLDTGRRVQAQLDRIREEGRDEDE